MAAFLLIMVCSFASLRELLPLGTPSARAPDVHCDTTVSLPMAPREDGQITNNESQRCLHPLALKMVSATTFVSVLHGSDKDARVSFVVPSSADGVPQRVPISESTQRVHIGRTVGYG